MAMWEDVKKNLREWYAVTSDKTSEVARITSLRYDKFGISRDIERQFSELGNLVYTGLKEGRPELLADPRVGALVARLDGLEQELRDKEAAIAAIRDRRERRGAAASSAREAQPPYAADPEDGPDEQDSTVLDEQAAWTAAVDNPDKENPEIQG